MSAIDNGSGRQAAIDRALARAVVARFLAGALHPGVGKDPAAQVPHPVPDVLEPAARTLDGDGRVLRAVRALADGPPPPPGARERLFGHTLRGAVCPYETEYGRRALIQQAHELADLAGFYEAFGLEPAERLRERPDHVACELGFLEFLSRKEAYALEAEDPEMLEVTRRAIGKFLGEHLGRFGRAFSVSLEAADPGGFYARVGALCETFLVVECARNGVAVGPAMLELRSTDEEAVPMACGSGQDLVQIGAPVDLEG